MIEYIGLFGAGGDLVSLGESNAGAVRRDGQPWSKASDGGKVVPERLVLNLVVARLWWLSEESGVSPLGSSDVPVSPSVPVGDSSLGVILDPYSDPVL